MIESVYLAGPITGLTYGEAMGWRETAIRELTTLGYDVFSPMRHKRHLADEFEKDTLPHSHETFRDPFERDKHDIARSDYMIANLSVGPWGLPNVGSLIEMGMANTAGVYIITIPHMETGEIHPFIKGVSNDIVWSLEDALALLAEYRPITPEATIMTADDIAVGMAEKWSEKHNHNAKAPSPGELGFGKRNVTQ